MESNHLSENEFAEIHKLINTDAGRELLELIRRNGAADLNEALIQAQMGDFSQAKNIVSNLLSSPEAAELMDKIGGNP